MKAMGNRSRDRSIHAFYIVVMFTLVLLPTASGAGVNKNVFRYGAGFFLALAFLPFIFRLLRLDTRPWSREHRGYAPLVEDEERKAAVSAGTIPEEENDKRGLPGEERTEKTPGNIFHTLNDVIFRPYHPVFGVVGFISVLIHGILEGECGRSTLIALAILFGYVLTGWGIYSGEPKIGDLKSNRMFHVSWVVAILFIAIVVGHTMF